MTLMNCVWLLLAVSQSGCILNAVGQPTGNIYAGDGKQKADPVNGDILYLLYDEVNSLRRELASLSQQMTAQMNSVQQHLNTLDSRFGQMMKNQSINFPDSADSTCEPKDCSELRMLGFNESGVYRVYPTHATKRREAYVYCDMSSSDTWLVFQRRKDGSVDFNRGWDEYTNGFGDPSGEFWLGNEKLYLLTASKKYKLRIELEDYGGFKRYAEYSIFSVSFKADKFRLTVLGYSGDAGDSLSDHNGQMFSTTDVDNDSGNGHCAKICHAGWWFANCYDSNLNGRYLHGDHTTTGGGIEWVKFRGNRHSMKTTEMKISPNP